MNKLIIDDIDYTENKRKIYGLRKQDIIDDYIKLIIKNGKTEQENKRLKDQIEYLNSGEYINQLRLERDLLQDLVYEGELSKEVYDIVKITNDNTRLAERLQQRDEVIEECIESIQNFMTHIDDGFCADMMTFIDILNRYKGNNK